MTPAASTPPNQSLVPSRLADRSTPTNVDLVTERRRAGRPAAVPADVPAGPAAVPLAAGGLNVDDDFDADDALAWDSDSTDGLASSGATASHCSAELYPADTPNAMDWMQPGLTAPSLEVCSPPFQPPSRCCQTKLERNTCK